MIILVHLSKTEMFPCPFLFIECLLQIIYVKRCISSVHNQKRFMPFKVHILI